MREKEPTDEADRRPGVEVHYALLPDECGGGAVQRRADRTWVVIDPRLSPVEQRCRLAHELIHLDRGSSARCRWSPRSWDPCIVREEMHVDQEVADWLVDSHELWVLVGGMLAAGEDVTAREVAADFEVTKPIARIALDALARRQGLELAS